MVTREIIVALEHLLHQGSCLWVVGLGTLDYKSPVHWWESLANGNIPVLKHSKLSVYSRLRIV